MSKVRIKNANHTPVMNSLTSEFTFVDNELQNSLNRLNLWYHLKQSGLSKRSGYCHREILFTVIVWVFLRKDSIKCFCSKFLSCFLDCGKDVVYDFVAREDINWSNLHLSLSKEVYLQHDISTDSERAFVVDDTLKRRSGKKVEGSSSHFDHTEGRCTIGQQVVELGLTSKKGFIPIGQQMFIGDKRVYKREKEFKDGRSAAAKSYRTAEACTKHDILEQLVSRAVRRGITAKYLLGDTWFACKKNIKLSLKHDMTGVFRMKRGNMKYLFQGKEYKLPKLYLLIKRRLEKCKNKKWKTATLKVQLDISDDKNKQELITVKLVFSCPKNPKKGEWAAFLTTDINMNAEKVLEVYAMRWGIEVYFKEAKQNMGFLKEQTGNYVCHYASMHLTAIRYLLLFDSMHLRGCSFGEIRNEISGNMEMIGFASLLWELFKAIIYGVLDSFKKKLGENMIKEIKQVIQASVEQFLEQALQLDSNYIKNELKAEKAGLLV